MVIGAEGVAPRGSGRGVGKGAEAGRAVVADGGAGVVPECVAEDEGLLWEVLPECDDEEDEEDEEEFFF